MALQPTIIRKIMVHFVTGIVFLGIVALIPFTSFTLNKAFKEPNGQFLSAQNQAMQIIENYKSSAYSSFLEKNNREYLDSKKDFAFDSILEERKTQSKLSKKTSSVEVAAQKETAYVNFLTKAQSLSENEGEGQLSKNILSMGTKPLSRDELISLSYVESLHQKFKGDGKTPLENRLIDLDIEYTIKTRMQLSDLEKSKINSMEYQKNCLILQLDQTSAMLFACQACEEITPSDFNIIREMKGYETISATILEKKALLSSLSNLKAQKTKPLTPYEEKVLSLHDAYLDEINAL